MKVGDIIMLSGVVKEIRKASPSEKIFDTTNIIVEIEVGGDVSPFMLKVDKNFLSTD